MKVRQLNTDDRRDVARFIQVSFDLYQQCPQWVPPLITTLKQAMDRRRHPFYNHSEAAFFLAEDGDRLLGRIAVLAHRRYNDYTNEKVAFFYYPDFVDDVDVVEQLISAAAEWTHNRGLTTLLGPKGMLRSDPYGVLIEGFEYSAGMVLPYNYPYYAQRLEEVGLQKEVDYLTGYVTAEDQLSERFFRIVERIKKRCDFWVKSFSTKREMRSWIPEIQRVNNKAFTEVWGYYPIDEAEVRMIGDQLLMIADPQLMKVVMSGEEIAGFAFVFPDVAEALKAVGGRLWPFGWLRLLIAMKRTKRLLGNGVGLLPQYQGLGASAMLYAEIHDTLRSRGAEHMELIQVMESNIKSLGDMNRLGAKWHKRHRVYRLEF